MYLTFNINCKVYFRCIISYPFENIIEYIFSLLQALGNETFAKDWKAFVRRLT